VALVELVAMFKALEKAAFSVGYGIYKTRLGSAMHQQTCAEFANKEPHSKTIRIPLIPGYHVSIVSILHDNFCYLIADENSKTCLAVDPADAEHVLRAVQAEGLTLTGVLTTHGHWDHAGGNEQIREKFPSIKIYGSAVDQVPGMTVPVTEGDKFWFPAKAVPGCRRLIVEVWEAPCHTKGHVLFLVTQVSSEEEDDDDDDDLETWKAGDATKPRPLALFTGDTLFSGGTGKFFEGSAAQMADNLKRIATLPANVKVFCGHEYTVNNYKFAAVIEPDNTEVRERLKWAERLRRDSLPTMPTSIGEEVATNPYMRIVTSRAVCSKLAMSMFEVTGELMLREGQSDYVAVLGELRRIKDDNVLRSKVDSTTTLGGSAAQKAAAKSETTEDAAAKSKDAAAKSKDPAPDI